MKASFMPAPWPAQPGKSGVGGDWIYGVCKARKDSTFAGAGKYPGLCAPVVLRSVIRRPFG